MKMIKPTNPNANWQRVFDNWEKVNFMDDNNFKAIKNYLDKMETILIAKGNDYSNGENVYSAFEQIAERSNISVENVFKVLINVKIVRIKNLETRNNKPMNESLMDSYLDLANYIVLYQSYLLTHGYKENELE